MPSLLDDHPTFASAVRRILTAGLTPAKAADLMAGIATASKAIPLRQMDLWERALRAEIWAAERGANALSWKFWSRPSRFISWIDLCSADGYKREAALRVLSGGAVGAFALALAFRRLNDWVPEVRVAAHNALPRLASSSQPEDVARVLWHLLAHWDTWGRLEQGGRDLVAAVVSSEPVSLALKSMILDATTGPAALVLSQCARFPRFDPWIQAFAEGAAQPSVRARAFRWLFAGQTSWVTGRRWRWIDVAHCKGKFEPILESRALAAQQAFGTTWEAAIADRSPAVRRVAAEHLVRELPHLGAKALPFAQRAANDRDRSVADRGKFVLKQHYPDAGA